MEATGCLEMDSTTSVGESTKGKKKEIMINFISHHYRRLGVIPPVFSLAMTFYKQIGGSNEEEHDIERARRC